MINRIDPTASPLHASVRRDVFLKDIVTLIVARYQPSRVFLFGSRARGDFKSDSDYDLLIEVAEVPRTELHGVSRMFHLNDLGARDVQIHVRLPGELEEQSDDPGTIDWDVVREGVLLFSYEDSAARAARRTVVREKRRKGFGSVEEWLRLARQDLELAEEVAPKMKQYEESICFHCQQSAEKYLKALLVNAGTRPLRQHDLTGLLAQTKTAGFDLSGLLEDCRYLTPFAVDLRYPPSIEIDAERALASARRIAAAVEQNLKAG
jgi:HEPN domain-containing protein/predicted nucleotidyltransferase